MERLKRNREYENDHPALMMAGQKGENMKTSKKEELNTKMCGELQETICTWDNIYRSCQDGWETFKLAIEQFLRNLN